MQPSTKARNNDNFPRDFAMTVPDAMSISLAI